MLRRGAFRPGHSLTQERSAHVANHAPRSTVEGGQPLTVSGPVGSHALEVR
jgi:hypothetical protein